MAFLPRDFVVPAVVEHERFRMRSITINDLVKDYDAVMSSQAHLWSMFGDVWGWPQPDLTMEEDLVDLGWHQKEFQRRSSFDYAVMRPDESQLLGCVYVDPSSAEGVDAEVVWWVRASELASGLDDVLGDFLRTWIEGWPFSKVLWPGRTDPW